MQMPVTNRAAPNLDWIADHSLIQIPDLNQDMTFLIGKRPKISGVAIAANPDGRALRKFSAATTFQPFVELDGAAPHINVRRPCHLQISSLR
jgi:hypothetical protein